MTFRKLTRSAACLVMLAAPATGWSILLTEPAGASETFSLPGTSLAVEPELRGVVVGDFLSSFSISGAGETLTGQIQNRVFRSDSTGTLTFYWRIIPSSDTPQNGDISAFRLIGFDGGWSLDANYRTDALGDAAPDAVRYFGSSVGAVNFLFDTDEVGQDNTSSNFFFLHTDATHFDRSGSFDLTCAELGCLSTSYSTFAPTVARVPEPLTAWLLATGILGLAISKWRKVV